MSHSPEMHPYTPELPKKDESPALAVWPEDRRKELAELQELFREIKVVNRGSNALWRITRCIEIAEKLTYADMGTCRQDFFSFLVNQAVTRPPSPSVFSAPTEIQGAAKPPRSVFVPPLPHEVETYSTAIGYPMDGQAWCDSYAQKGWMVGRGKPMKDWNAAIRNWKANGWQPVGQGVGRGRPEPALREVK